MGAWRLPVFQRHLYWSLLYWRFSQTDQRLIALQEVANEMCKGTDRPDRGEYLEQIAAYNRSLHEHVVSLDEKKSNPVAQDNFATGDIELF